MKGVQQIIDRYGEAAGRAATQHIMIDLREEGWTENDRFPKDEADYVKMGLF